MDIMMLQVPSSDRKKIISFIRLWHGLLSQLFHIAKMINVFIIAFNPACFPLTVGNE